ncbi:Brca2 [Trypoxylus dichotomus]
MFTSASGKDIMMNKALLVDAERKLEQIDSNSPNAKENGVENSHGKTTTTEQNKKCNDARSLNVNNRDKLIKKFMDKAHKLYHDVQKSDASLNRDKIENSIDNDLNTNYLSKLNKNIQDTTPNDFCGFKLASGKDMKISEKAFKNAQKMYQDIDEISVKNWIKGNTNETSVIQNVKNVSPKSKRTKQKTQITHGNIDSCNPNEKVDHVITGKLAKNKNNTRHKDVSLKINEAQNGKNQLTSVEMTNFSCGFKSAGGKNINISPAALEKAKRLFDDNRPAGDSTHQTLLFSNFENTCNTKTDAPEKHVSESYAKGDNTKFCMGDFENDNDTKKQSDANNTPLNASGSKRAFELLEDVVETVDYALEKIKKGKLHKPSNVKRRLGISRCKQINISKEKIDKAKRLFSNENFTDTIRDLSVMTTPKVSNITANSTPIKDNAPQIRDVRFSMNTIESEITPIKNSSVDKNSDMVAQSGSVIIKNRTPGTLDDWYATVLKQINTLKDTLKGLENKKSYLEKQMSFVHYGDKEHKRQRVGVLYEKKMSNSSKLHLKSVEIDDSSNVQNVINDVTSKNADMIHFNSISSEYSGRTEDGAIIIPNAQNLVGLSEIEIAFRTMVGVEPSLIPDGWIVNHYRLIVWKLASYERFFSGQLSGCLTIENIVQQLKYRYDREIDRAQRPAIRKILEKDDVSQKRMVLCVSDIIEVPNNGIELELTDGWYSIRTLIDNPLIAAVRRKKIRIGTKLLTCGAQLLNCDGCHPLQITDFVKLKISYNCTRRAVWYAKLGYQKCPEPFAISLSSIHPNGGVIGCIKVHILRIYPIRYMEQVDDKKVWRNTRAEEKYANSFENDRLEKIEKIHYSVHEKFQRDLCSDLKSKYIDQSTLNIGEILKITCPKTLYSLLESSNDPDSLMEVLLPSQRVSILEYRQQVCLQQEQEISKRISEEMEKLKLNKRKVTPILKLLVLDDCYKSEKPRQFCIWNPKEDDMSLLKEGFSISVYNVVPRFNGDLFSNAKTYFKINKINTSYAKFKRQVSPISMVLDPSYKPLFNEFDTVGLVVQININTHDQNLWITDIRGIMLLIKIRDGPALCSLLEGIMKCQIISLSNLIYCKPQKDFGLAFANQFTIITASPQQGHLQDGIQLLKSKLPEDLSQLVKQCELDIERHMAKIDLKQSFFNPSNLTTSLNNSFNISDDNTLATSRLTPIDVAMSLIDTDKFG